jgi:hypothetical protein
VGAVSNTITENSIDLTCLAVTRVNQKSIMRPNTIDNGNGEMVERGDSKAIK